MRAFSAEFESPTVTEDVLTMGRLLILEVDALATVGTFTSSLSAELESPAVTYDPISTGIVCDAMSSLSDTLSNTSVHRGLSSKKYILNEGVL